MFSGKLTDVSGIRIGHAQDTAAKTGVTAVHFPSRAVASVCVQGGAPGTRETDLLMPGKSNRQVDAVMLCGGSAFGLAAADGAMRWLEERGQGVTVGNYTVPIVPAAVIFDLAVGNGSIRPDAAMGYAAMEALGALEDAQGAIGGGTGATIGKALPGALPARGGLGMASLRVGEAVLSSVIIANPFGDVYDYRDGTLIAAGKIQGQMLPSIDMLIGENSGGSDLYRPVGGNTVIGLLATDAALDKEQANRLAELAQDGLAMSIRPTHTPFDGDTIFSASTGNVPCEFALLCAAAPIVVARAVANAAWQGALAKDAP